jgi:hypothetical protein
MRKMLAVGPCCALLAVAAAAHAQGYAPPPGHQPTPAPSGDDGDGDGDGDDDDGGSSRADEILVPSTRPMFFVGGVGPEFFGLNVKDDGALPGAKRTRLRGRAKIVLDFGYHFSGDGEGPAIGVTIEQSADDNFYVFNPAFKFWWDIQITDLAVYVAPFAAAGYALGACKGCSLGHAFNLDVGAEGRMVFVDRWMAFFRPVQLDFFFGDFLEEKFLLHYAIVVGGGVTF